MRKALLLSLTTISIFISECAGNRINQLTINNDVDPVLYAGLDNDLDSEISSMALFLFGNGSYNIEIQYSSEENEIVSEGKGTYSIRKNQLELIPDDSLHYDLKYEYDGASLISRGDAGKRLIKIENRIFERRWKLIELNGQSINATGPNEREPYAEFKILNNRIFGSGGCNRYAGYYNINNHQIKISKLLSTKMACMEVYYENDFYRILETANEFSISGDTLILLNAGLTTARFLYMSQSN